MKLNEATPEQIKEWKEKHLDVYAIEIPEANKICYLRQPNRKELSYASQLGTKDPMKFNEYILSTCWLGGDEEIKTNDNLFLSILHHIESLMEYKKSELKKL